MTAAAVSREFDTVSGVNASRGSGSRGLPREGFKALLSATKSLIYKRSQNVRPQCARLDWRTVVTSFFSSMNQSLS